MSHRAWNDAYIAFVADVDAHGNVKYRHTVMAGKPHMEWAGFGFNEETGRWYEDLVPVQLDGAIILRADLDVAAKRSIIQGLCDYAMAHMDEAQAKAREHLRAEPPRG